MGKVTCPVCPKVFDSEFEFRLHWQHSHRGPMPKIAIQAETAKPAIDAPPLSIVEVPVAVDSEDSYSLAVSSEGLGELYPVLKDAHNNIIDGYHRKGETPLWHEEVRPQIDTPVKLALAQLAVNFCRRRMSPEEIRERITFLAENGVKAEDIAKQTGIKLRTVQKYIPQEFKDPVKVAARLGIKENSDASMHHTVAIPESIQGEQLPVSSVPRVRTFAEAAAETAKVAESSFSPMAPQTEPEIEEESIPLGTPICPVCEASLNLSEYEEIKRKIKAKYGLQIQTLLFPKEP